MDSLAWFPSRATYNFVDFLASAKRLSSSKHKDRYIGARPAAQRCVDELPHNSAVLRGQM
jgi:hypothetical protein